MHSSLACGSRDAYNASMQNTRAGLVYIGCPIWGHKEWVGTFFPERTPPSDFLRLYSRKLTTVEGNTTFYAVPSHETIARWRAETPPGFRICPKVPREISHAPALEGTREVTLAFVERMRGLGERLGPIFLQLPPSFGPVHLRQLENWLGFWPGEVRLAVEVRHPAFFKQEHGAALNALLNRCRTARVIMDTRPIRVGSTEERSMLQARERKPDLPVAPVITTDFTFLRYIGHTREEINAPFLDSWAVRLAQWLEQGVALYVFCHCPFEVHSPDICYSLYRRLAQLTSLPDLLWASRRRGGSQQIEQGRLF
jgi:uncharacterized protein YecE (DUF72 family)